jgi:HEAT repeat protein
LAPVFIERLKDESPRVRYQAAGGLAAIAADSAAAPVLRRLAADEKAPDLALKAMSGLAARGENVNIDLAERQLRSADIDGRLLAVEVLSRAASAQALELLAKVTTEDNSPRVRVAAATELVKRLQRKGSAR